MTMDKDGYGRQLDPSEIIRRARADDTLPLPIEFDLIELDTDGEVQWSPYPDPDFKAQHEAGQFVLYSGRSSHGMNQKGIEMAVDDAFGAASSGEGASGLKTRHLFPERDLLIDLLRNTQNSLLSHGPEGERFRNHFRLVVLPRHRFAISLSVGTGRMVNEDQVQPHGDWIRRCLRDFRPGFAGVAFKRLDRLVREGWSMGPFLGEVRARHGRLGSFLIADNYIRLPIDANIDVTVFLKGISGAAEAAGMVTRREVRVPELTGHVSLPGTVSYAAPNNVPAGLFQWRSRLTNRCSITIESPALFPERSEVEKGFPEVTKPDGSVPDIPLIINGLAELVESGVHSKYELVDYLVEEYFTTHGLRRFRRHGPTAYFGGPTKPWVPGQSRASEFLNPILNSLDFYKSGELIVWIDKRKGLSKTIEGLKPPGGQWATATALEALIDWKIDRKTRSSKFDRPGVWTSFPVTLDGFQARMMVNRGGGDPELTWRFEMTDADRAARAAMFGGLKLLGVVNPTIPDNDILAWLLDALAEMNGKPLHKYLERDSFMSHIEALRSQETTLRSRVASIEKLQEVAKQRLTGESGILLDGQALKMVNDEFNLRDKELTRLGDQIDYVRAQVTRQLSQPRLGGSEEAVKVLLTALESRDSTAARNDVQRLVRDISVSTEVITFFGTHGSSLKVTGDLVFANGRDPLAVPFSGTVERGEACRNERYALDAVAALRAGDVDFASRSPLGARVAPYVRHLLGVSDRWSVLDCRDPHLMRVLMALDAPDPVAGEEPAQVLSLRDLARDVALVEHLGGASAFRALTAHLESRPEDRLTGRWLRPDRRTVEVEALIAYEYGMPVPEKVWLLRQRLRASGRDYLWDFDQASPAPNPCAHCKSTLLGLSRMREVQGYLCLQPECRRDAAGVRWSGAAYDQFLMAADSYVALGVELRIADHRESDRSKPKVRAPKQRPLKYRHFRDLSQDYKSLIASEYAAGETVLNIAREHNLMRQTVSDIAMEARLEPRNRSRASAAWLARLDETMD